MKNYSVREMFLTLQGEGRHSGRAAVFCRFAGCNLWSGREEDRSTAICRFCDTDFLGITGTGGGKFASAKDLAMRIAGLWPICGDKVPPYVVFTGGEPLLQLDEPLIESMHMLGFEIAIETNGTIPIPPGIDWVCVSPKARAELVVQHGDELKLIYPQQGAEPEKFVGLDFRNFYIQPMDGPDREENTRLAVAYCRSHPQWRLSLQTHKFLGIP